jgi:AbrB family looped-hinge helix DNA binding protein
MRVTSKGQVTIPQELRKKFGIHAQADVEFVEEGGKIVVRVAKRPASRFRKQVGRGDVTMSTDQILRLTRGG